MAYERVEGPLGPARSDVHAAQVCAAIFNSQRGKRGRRFNIEHFLIEWDRRAGPQTPEQQLSLVRAITRAMGGEVPEGGEPDDGPGRANRPRRWRHR